MKDKPISHKNQNTFRFSSFSERISKINIDVIHHIGRTHASPDEATTFFLEAIDKWVDLNYSQDYMDLQKDIGPEIRNLSQIMFRQHDIINILLKYLEKDGSLALDAILELIVALARDLQYEFYPHFPKFFHAITSHLSTQDTELLEKLFTCLAYLFKFLWKYMIKDIENVYRLFSPLLDKQNKEHIVRFAVESFAFLIRKVLAKNKLFSYIFDELQEQSEPSGYGVGQLCFEVMKGVKEQFHSCTENVLKLLLQFLGKEKYHKGLLVDTYTHMLHLMALHTTKNYCYIIQKIFCDVIRELLEKIKGGEKVATVDHLKLVLELFSKWINAKDGSLTSDNEIVQVLVDLCEVTLSESCMYQVVEIIASTLTTCCIQYPYEKMSKMISQIYSQSTAVFIYFTKKMHSYGMFEKDILPSLLSACLNLIKQDPNPKEALFILAETIVILKPVITCAEDVKSFTKLYLCVPEKQKIANSLSDCSVLEDLIFETLTLAEDFCEKGSEKDFVGIWSALICLPHLRIVDSTRTSIILGKLMKNLVKVLLSIHHSDQVEIEQVGFVLCQAYISLLITSENKTFPEDLSLNSLLIELLKKHPKSFSVLRLVDCHITSQKQKDVNRLNVLNLLPELLPNLASPFHLVRLHTLNIFNMSQNKEHTTESVKQNVSVIELCLLAEKVPLTIQDYRERIKWLRKLEFRFITEQYSSEQDEFFKQLPIYYLIGVLYVNFKFLWDPTIDILETYAHGDTKIFWEVFGKHLLETTDKCEKDDPDIGTVNLPIDTVSGDSQLINETVFNKCLCAFSGTEEKPDIGNHRILLWKAMEKFTDVVESRNKIIVPLLFRLMANEIVKVDSSMASTQALNKARADEFIDAAEEFTPLKSPKRQINKTASNVCKKSKLDDSVVQSETDDVSKLDDSVVQSETNDVSHRESEEEDEESGDENEGNDKTNGIQEVKKAKVVMKDFKGRKISVAKTLVAYLSVFSKFRGPKGIYKTDELQKLYLELLSYHDSSIQKLAFDCIMTYKYKYLIPYKDNFYRILDNKTFKNEVVLFSLDSENDVIQQEHRVDVLAVLMRILYGKMLHKTGNNTTGAAQANTRRSLVLRFLAGCKAHELKMFFELVFLPFKNQLNDSTLIAVKNIRKSLDLSKIVPLRRQHSALNILGLIFQHLGNLVPDLLPWLLKVLVVIAATSTKILEMKDQIHDHIVMLLKNIRILSTKKLIQFYKLFPTYDFHPEETDAIFEAVIWPVIARLEIESVNQPSPLLQLLSTWSDNSRYFILFSKHHESSKFFTTLPHIIALYTSPKSKPVVLRFISRIIYQLLTFEEKEGDDEKQTLTLNINNSLCVPKEEGGNKDNINYGVRLLLPYVSYILKRIEDTVLSLSKKKSKRVLAPRDLTILLRISSYVDGPEQSFRLITLLIPFLHKPKMGVESEVLILTTIASLMKTVDRPEHFMKALAPLFGKLTNQNSRLALAKVFTTIAELKTEFSRMAVVINKINAFDSNMMEEPDYQQRLDGHKEALEIIRGLTEKPVNEDFMRIIIFNSSFMIRTCDDMALRSSCSHLMEEIIKVISAIRNSSPELFSMLIFDTLLLEIHKGLMCSAEVKRHEFIRALSTILRFCKECPQFKGLAALTNDDQDLDFWENIRHLQVHRRARALLRFSSSLKTANESQEKISVHYLMTYMVPIVQSFVFDDAYKKHVHVIDAAIETLGSIASVLPWHHYEPLLKQYLDLISKDAEHHKTIIKIIVSLLNAFPYNLKDNVVSEQEKDIKKSIESTEVMDVDIADGNSVEANLQPQDALKTEEAPSMSTNELTPALRNRINIAIRKNILPLMHRSLMKKTKHDDEHKLAGGNYYPEDDEILRVPIALAMIKLLQKLPSGTLEKALPGLLLKMCELLKSRTESIRETARDTLVKMMQSLGPKYFYFLLKEIKGVMKRGYQVHVMTFSINSVLINFADQLSSGDLDECLQDLTEICISELFSDTAEEKEVAKITGKVKEARSIKSYSIFQVLSKHLSESLLLDLIQPLKEVLLTKHSHKTLRKVSECFRHIAQGLSENDGLSEKGLLIFIHAIVSESIPGLNPKKYKQVEVSSKYERPDIYLVPKEPGRSGPPAKINEKTNIHILVEFGLQIFQFCLKKERISKGKKEILEMLDPFVSFFSQCLSSNHMKIISSALRCLLPLYRFSLPSFKTQTKKIIESLFILINKYAAVGMGQGENFEMIVMCFKLMTTLVRDTSYHKFTEEQLHSLLSYVEQDIHDYTRQGTAFSLLKAILGKKLGAPELPGIMSKIAEMAITAEQDYVRSQCRQLCLQYMLDYPLGKKLVKSISFFIAQLEYRHEHGRVSAMEITNSMMNMFPEEVLKKHAALFLVPIAARLVNDESPSCRKMAAECIKKLLQKIDHDGRAVLFSIALNWLDAKKVSHKRLGAQVCGLFAEVEKEQFEHRLSQILPVYIELIDTFSNVKTERPAEERVTDHFLYHLLNSFTKMLSMCSVIKKPEYSENFNRFWDQLQQLILYPHMWVQLATSQLFGLLFAAFTVEEVQVAVFCEDEDVYINSKQKLRDLSADFATQINSQYLNEALGEQAVRNLVYLGKVISVSSVADMEENGEEVIDKSYESSDVQISLSWMIRKMCREAKKEVAENPSHSLKRKCVFMFIAAISHELEKEKLIPQLNTLLLPLCREVADGSKYTDEELKKNAQEALDLIKTVVGVEVFTEHYAAVQSTLFKKKIKRKQEKAKEAVTDPEKYAKKRIKKQQSKKESKKRKILFQKGKRKSKKAKFSDLVISAK